MYKGRPHWKLLDHRQADDRLHKAVTTIEYTALANHRLLVIADQSPAAHSLRFNNGEPELPRSLRENM